MGNSQSSSTSQKDISAPLLEESNISVSERGLKSEKNVAGNAVLSSDDSSITEYVSDSDDEELMEEEMEEMMERERIFADARKLKQLAGWYLHPEEPVEVDCTASARCYFSQPCASEQETFEESEEAANVLRDAMMLKKLATDYLHPEIKMTEDSTACARCYFSRPSAEEQLSYEEAEEVACIMEDAKQLSKLAVDFNHPEKPVVTSACARNYFSRPSAPLYESQDEAEEREKILADVKALKKLAVDYMHPENPVEVDATATARNYFSRPSAPLYESEDEAEEREKILADAKALKKLAVDYMHPERPVEVHATATARNFFARASAPEYTTMEEEEVRAEILQDCLRLKNLAKDYLHPELPVEVDGMAKGRNYFSRYSASDQTTEEFEQAREEILADVMELKRLAADYLHPERPVQVDSTASARNYFMRYSAPEQATEEEEIERQQILADCMQLQKYAGDYLHPERPVQVDSMALGRNYFSRYSAAEQTSEEDEEALQEILLDAANLKKLAVDYLHPERPVEVDATATARSYFSRPSAPETTSPEEEEERSQIMADLKQLKKLAVDYYHPELKVVASDPTVFGRNYFSRPSAPEQASLEDEEERTAVLADAQKLKALAVDYLHPEIKVTTSDPSCYGRNYFTRSSGPEQTTKEEDDERARILADAQQLKQLAMDYRHPEIGVSTSDGACFGRNYFARASAPEQTSKEESDELAQILADAQELKKFAVDYLHPENKVVTTDPAACGRNYFSRPSAPGLLGKQTYTEISSERDGARQAYKQEPYGFFDMDEEVFSEIRENLVLPVRISGKPSKEEDEGDMSRSPSSVMLFGLGGGEEAY